MDIQEELEKANMVGEERFRKRKWGEPKQHIYYHCARQFGQCKEPYISEEKLVKQILRYINFMHIAHPNFLNITNTLTSSVSAYKSVRDEILYEQNINPNSVPLDPVNFARHVLTNGTIEEKRDFIKSIGRQLYFHNQVIYGNKLQK